METAASLTFVFVSLSKMYPLINFELVVTDIHFPSGWPSDQEVFFDSFPSCHPQMNQDRFSFDKRSTGFLGLRFKILKATSFLTCGFS